MFFTWLQAPTHSYPFLVLHFMIFSAGSSSSHQPLLAGDPRPQCPVFLSSLSAVYPSLVSPTVISVNAICMPSSSHGRGRLTDPHRQHIQCRRSVPTLPKHAQSAIIPVSARSCPSPKWCQLDSLASSVAAPSLPPHIPPARKRFWLCLQNLSSR